MKKKRRIKDLLQSVPFMLPSFAGMIVFSLLPIFGVMLHTGAFWITDEKTIRRLSILGSPFWLLYNLVSHAYGSAIGDVSSMISIGVAIYRYDIRKKEKKEEKTDPQPPAS